MRQAAFGLWMMVFAAPPLPAADGPDLGESSKLKILYAGAEGSERAKSFVDFLKQHFAIVGEVDVARLSVASAAAYDVVIADAKRLYPMDDAKPSLDLPQVDLGAEFKKPIVMIGAMGGRVQHHTKIGWL